MQAERCIEFEFEDVHGPSRQVAVERLQAAVHPEY
jgi:hypothetical protein